MSIKARLILTISVLIALAFTCIGAVTVTVIRDRMIARIDASLLDAPLRPERSAFGGQGGEPDAFSQRATAIMLVNADGDVIQAIPAGFADDPDPLPDLTGVNLDLGGQRIVTAPAADGSRHRYRVLLTPVGGGRYLATAASLDTVDATTRNLLIVIGLTGLLVLAVIVGSVWLTIRHGLRPIDDMIATAGLIARGDLSRRVEYDDAASEVGQLGQALNVMLGRIEASFEAQQESEQRLRQFVADASHELRTPLTSIRGYAELHRSGAAGGPEGTELVMARIESEGDRMGRLIDDLLLLARLDQGRPLEREPVDLVALADEAVQAARVIDPARPIAFAHPDAAHLLGDAGRLRQVIDNLLTNTRVHTEPGTPVHVRISLRADEVTLTVADEGPGIASVDVAHVFDRFYRGDASRSRASGGTGLGLSIVASIVAAHGGRVSLDSAPGQGTTVTITLARADSATPTDPVSVVTV